VNIRNEEPVLKIKSVSYDSFTSGNIHCALHLGCVAQFSNKSVLFLAQSYNH
jgi:hypothetical protein